jgi:hypothetical protein
MNIDGLIAERDRLRDLAATCYAGLGAELDLPEAWMDVFLAASEGKPFSTEGLLPFRYHASRELLWLRYFYREADFGPADDDVRAIYEDNFVAKYGPLPEGYAREE